MIRRLPIRWRLTLWYGVLLAVAMALFSGTLYVVLRQQLYAGLDEQLLNQAALTLAAVHVDDGSPRFDPSTLSGADGEYFLRLLDAVGRPMLDTGGPTAGVPVDRNVIASALAGKTSYSTALDEDGETIRIISVPVR